MILRLSRTFSSIPKIKKCVMTAEKDSLVKTVGKDSLVKKAANTNTRVTAVIQ